MLSGDKVCVLNVLLLRLLTSQVYLNPLIGGSRIMTQLAPAPGVAGLVPAGTWQVDGAHSGVEFGIKHLLITTVKGTFGNFEGTIDVAEDGTAHAKGVIRADSIDTN